MKIVQLIQKPQLRGAEIFACQLSNHLTELGHQVKVISIYEGEAQLPFNGEILELNRTLKNRFVDFKGWKNFSKIIKQFKPDIIQANAADTLKFAVSSKLLFSWNVPIVFRNANKMGDFIDSRLKWHLNNFYLSKVAYVISVSKECEKDFIQTFSYSKNKINTVEIGVEEQNLGKIPEDIQEVFNKGPVITHIGGFVPEKNHNGLIQIFSKLLKEFPNAQLLLLGKGKLEENIRQRVTALGILNKVHFLGYRADVFDILHHSQAFVLPSLIEGLPAVILEAMYAKTPVIVYDVGGIGEVVKSNKTGWLIKKNDEDDFIKSLTEVLNTPKDKIQEIFTAKEMVSEKFKNQLIAKRFLSVYRSCLSN